MNRIKKEDLEKMYGKMVEERDLTILGFNGKMHFEIYDGLAYCENHDGDEYVMKYPKLEFIDDSVEMQSEIRKYLKMDEDAKISVLDVLQTFNELDKNGVRIVYNGKTKTYEPKNMWLVNTSSLTD